MAAQTERAAHSIKEFCDLVGIGRSRVYEEIRLGRIRALKAGRRTLIPNTEIAAWLSRLPPTSAPADGADDQ